MAAKKTSAKAPSAQSEEKKPEEKKEAAKPAEKKAAAAAAPKKAAPPPEQPKSKLADFLTSKKIDPRRVLSQSRALERLMPEDRAIRLAKRRGRKGDAAEGGPAKETRKPRSGRPVTRRAIHAALWGRFVSGPTKTRILKAVNTLLELKKAEKVDLKTLF
jgi:hypothetical protein